MENKRPVGLKRSSDFLKIKQEGKRKTLCSWLLLTYRKNNLGHLRFGCTVSGKVGPAVMRNRLKRWTREYFRKVAANGFDPEYDFNLVFRPMQKGFYDKLEYQKFVESMDQVVKIFQQAS